MIPVTAMHCGEARKKGRRSEMQRLLLFSQQKATSETGLGKV